MVKYYGRARQRIGSVNTKQLGLKMDDIGLWELNKAFAVQVIYCSAFLGIPDDILNVNSGSISISHPYGV